MESNGEEENYEGGDDRDYPEVSENDIQNQNENNDKLNINKKIESSRDEILPKEDKVNDKQTKENMLSKDEEQKGQTEQNTNKPNGEEKKEQEEEKKSEDLLETLEKKVKVEIVPYKISSSYPSMLLAALEKSKRLRPKNLLGKEMGDITRTIDELKKDEEYQLKLEQLEDKNLEVKERDDKTHLSSYKQSANDGKTVIQDPFAVFHGAETAYIDQFYKLSDLFVICPLYYNYRISLEYCIGEKDGKKEYAA